VQHIIARLRLATQTKTIILLDYNTNEDLDDPTKPLSHAALVKAYVEGKYPFEDQKASSLALENKPMTKQLTLDLDI
jgi:hypothetical protein